MKKIIAIISLVICLCTTLVVPAFAVNKGFSVQDCIDYGVHIDNENRFITEAKGTYRVILKEGALAGDLLVFSSAEDFDFDCDMISLCALPDFPSIYNTINRSANDLIYLDSAIAEKIVASNVTIDFVSAEDITQPEPEPVPAALESVPLLGDFD